MTKQEAIELAGRIPKEANRSVRAKAGTTNGQGVVHVATTNPPSSETLASYGEWLASPLNKRNADHTPRPRKPRKGDEADEATVLTATDPHTIYSPED